MSVKRLLAVAGASLCTLLGAACLSMPAAAQDAAARYPDQPVRLVVVYQAGGANDIVARVLAERMSTTLGQQVLVVNKPGANGAIGAQYVATAPADGYTVLMGGAPLVVARALYKHPPVDFEKSLAPVGKAVNLSLVLVSRKQYPAQTFQQVVARERKQPGSTSMAITASAYEFYHARINKLAGTDFLKVPYPGVPAAMNDLNGNRVDLLIDTMAAQKPFLETGTTRALAVFGSRRLAELPGVPTLGELGMKGFEDQPYVGMLVPRGTPDPVIRKLNGALNAALAQPDVKARLEKLSFVVAPSTPEAFHQEMKTDADRFVEVGLQAGIEKQ
ncbi:MFS transporter [Cupriavidus sp. TKC]|uniref:Bug family tripartite tricarboxylate transporter substrate binding protein n=1 Tax=Cupriavidus sp. TKC TaxID=2880159 RepID=UPI0025A81432|nr:tripartite tricarboxylate transporter substrate binding protein [Cupriavidus sp. TKC]GMG93732.1 MFS transporter [Cupriavidus sp. TKC]